MVKVLPIHSKADIKKFVLFKNKLYKGHKYAIPTLVADEIGTLTPEKNPASEFCESQCFLAYDEKGSIVGRICAIINHKANQTWAKKEGRFGFFDFIEDFQVARALMDQAEKWITERGMTAVHGPLGFTDLDEEGMLVEGFDQLGTMVTLYNYPYYNEFMERMGYVKDVDWVEFKFDVPYPTPERVVKFAKIVEQKNNLTVVRCKNMKQLIAEGWGTKVFELINTAYAPLYGFSALTDRQIAHYVKMYLPIARMELISLVANSQGDLMGFGISMPSLSRALQKSGGRMLPLGWAHLLKALKGKRVDMVDLMLIAVHPECQNKGLTAILMNEIIGGMQKLGATLAESNPELESNETMQKQWDMFDRKQHKRRRAYIKQL